MDAAEEKAALRECLGALSGGFEGEGRAAERLRRHPAWRGAAVLFVTPEAALRQVRMNALADGKTLLMPTPGLAKGFVALEAARVPPGKRILAVAAAECLAFGARVPLDAPLPARVPLVVTSAWGATPEGELLSDGSGAADLEWAILSTLGWLAPGAVLAAVTEDSRVVPDLPSEPHDVHARLVVTPARLIEAPPGAREPGVIFWERLGERDVRRSAALHFLQRRAPGGPAPGDSP